MSTIAHAHAAETSSRNLYDLSLAELTALLAGWGQPAFRARQVWEWLYRHFAADAAALTSLPVALRACRAAKKRVDRAPRCRPTVETRCPEQRGSYLCECSEAAGALGAQRISPAPCHTEWSCSRARNWRSRALGDTADSETP